LFTFSQFIGRFNWFENTASGARFISKVRLELAGLERDDFIFESSSHSTLLMD